MFGIVVRFDLKDEAAALGFDALVEETLPGIRAAEPETLVYAVHRVDGAPLSRVFYELYTSRDALGLHESTEHTMRFLAEKDQYLAGIRVEFLETPIGKVF